MDNIIGLRLEEALDTLGGKYEVKLIELDSPKKKYDEKRVVRYRIIVGKPDKCIEITYAGFPALNE